ncbi:MAG TPA: nuclear transport factor 2 family protein [Thermomicrobiales bacterium]|nr:nuclear transport factor 2 family protein [Thermomicrobiales bacterium]
MDALERLTTERACERVLLDALALVDAGRAEEALALFAPRSTLAGELARFQGQEQIRAFLRQRQRMAGRVERHVVTNLRLTVVDGQRVEGSAYLTLYRHDGPTGRGPAPLPGPLRVGEVALRFVRTPTEWRLGDGRVAVVFEREAPGEDA